MTTVPLRLRQGYGTTRVVMPVDFADLSTEYIGILYEGLLDFELRQAAGDDPVVFLALGDQPALPLSRLEGMDDKALRALLAKASDRSRPAEDGEGEDAADDDEAGEGEDSEAGPAGDDNGDDGAVDDGVEDIEGDTDDAGLTAGDDEPDGSGAGEDEQQAARDRVWAWARRAAVAGKVVRAARSKAADVVARHAAEVEAAARGLVAKLVLPGEWYLVRWGGTRKGAGTFYTPPGLAVPTVQRTLRPLAYIAPTGTDGRPDELAPAAEWTVRTPEEILALKVCDRAVGSGSFLVASLRFLTDALYESLYHHGGRGRRRTERC